MYQRKIPGREAYLVVDSAGKGGLCFDAVAEHEIKMISLHVDNRETDLRRFDFDVFQELVEICFGRLWQILFQQVMS